MEANEIMIGDYFRIAQTGKIIKIVAVDEPSGSVDYFDGDAGGVLTIGVEKIEPISLSTEILEKNGIKWLSTEPSGRKTYISSIEPPIIATWLKDHWLVSVGPAGSTKMPYVEIGWLNYVHQLQHAFHDCGIDKPITI